VPIRLAIVLIARNEEATITRLIESVLRETAGVPSEVVLVDSLSTDRTVEHASRYPVRILRLRPTHPVTPAAGRYVGFHATTSDIILFLDGDMELCPNWLQPALHVVKTHPDVAVLSGLVFDITGEEAREQALRQLSRGEEGMKDTQFAGGAAMYRRRVLDDVGPFNPYLHSDEEPELCLRIRRAGYRVVQLDLPIAFHFVRADRPFSTLVGRYRRKLFLGQGQVIRYLLHDPMLWPYIRERGYGLPPALALLAAAASGIASVAFKRRIWGVSWLVVALTVVGADVLRKRSFQRTCYALLHRLLIFDGLVRGFLLKPADAGTYPTDAEVVK
jgi:glycosyltransferase involved in cell wall biosynthesis